jgi:hypothetical protein
VCKLGIERKEEIERVMGAINNKKETNRCIRGLDKTKPVQEIKL